MSAWPVVHDGPSSGCLVIRLLPATLLSVAKHRLCLFHLSMGCVPWVKPGVKKPDKNNSLTAAKQAHCQKNLSTLHTNRWGTALSHTLCWHAITVSTHLQHERRSSLCTISSIWSQFSKQELITLLKSQPRQGMGRSILKYQHPQYWCCIKKINLLLKISILSVSFFFSFSFYYLFSLTMNVYHKLDEWQWKWNC